MTRRLQLTFVLLAALAAGCDAFTRFQSEPPDSSPGQRPGQEPPVVVRPDGQTKFESAVPDESGGNRTMSAENDAGAAPGVAADAPERQVEEADIVRLDGDTLYILNAYRGLIAVSLADPDHPAILGRAPVFGHPVEMYVRDGVGYIVVSDYFDYWAADNNAYGFHGSEIIAVDLKNPAQPIRVGSFRVPGWISDTRIVGDVLYAVSNRYAWYDYFGSSDTRSMTFVVSINLADPRAPYEVERVEFEGTSNNVHPTANLLYVAQPVEGRYWNDQATQFTLLDISDPAGDIKLASTFQTEGAVGYWNVSQEMARFQMDQFGKFFRVITHEGTNGTDGSQTLTVYDASNPASVEKVSELVIPNSGGLWATRFDGERVYLVTLVQKDPLEIVDLSNPYAPVLAKQLEIPGLLRLVIPKGDRLVALATDSAWGGGVGVAVFDVAVPSATRELGRAMIGAGSYAYSNAIWDDKALRIVDDKVVLLPFSGYLDSVDSTTGQKTSRYTNGLALVEIELASGKVAVRGTVEHHGQVQRALPHRERVVAFSDRVLQTLDIRNLESPRVTALLELARDISDFGIAEVAGSKYGVQLVGPDWYTQEGARLTTVPLADPDGDRVTLADVELGLAYGRLWTHGRYAYVAGQKRDWSTAVLEVFEVGADGSLTARGKLDLKGEDGWWWYNGAAALVDGPALAFATVRWEQAPTPTEYGWYDWIMKRSIHAIDLRDPLHPAYGGSVELPGESWAELRGLGARVFTTHHEYLRTVDGRPVGRWYVDRVDLSRPGAPVLLPKVNVPGELADVATRSLIAPTDQALLPEGQLLYTVDYQYGENWSVKNTLNVLWLYEDLAILQSSLEVPERIERARARGAALYATTQRWWDDPRNANDPSWWRKSTLRVFDVTTPDETQEVRAIDLQGAFAIRELLGGRLFLTLGSSGWGWRGGYGGGRCMECDDVSVGVAQPAGYYYSGGNGLLVYSVERELEPALLGFFRTFGWVNQIAVGDDHAYLASGLYGVQTVLLAGLH